jgi:hypothetical protein
VKWEKEAVLEEEEVVSDDGVYWGEKTRPLGACKRYRVGY